MKKMNCIVLAVGFIAATSTCAVAKKIGDGIRAYSIGKPYVVGGITYRPHEDPSYRVEGNASCTAPISMAAARPMAKSTT